MRKKIICIILSFSLLCLSCVQALALEKNDLVTIEADAVSEVNEIVKSIDDCIEIDTSEDKIYYDEEKIENIVEEIDIDVINEFYEANGLEKVSKDEIKQMYIECFDELSEELESGKKEILDNGTIVESQDDSFYLQGGSTYSKTYWWGRRIYKSTAAANTWAYKLNSAAAANAGAAALGAAVFGGVGAAPNGLTSAYCWGLANKISYVNSRTTRGIKADVHWTLVYSVNPQ